MCQCVYMQKEQKPIIHSFTVLVFLFRYYRSFNQYYTSNERVYHTFTQYYLYEVLRHQIKFEYTLGVIYKHWANLHLGSILWQPIRLLLSVFNLQLSV
ncbi:hypothetical protein XELAEV_18026455mg [Xenopus laevis]|uniref:Uncharacterized protein n=1 Tax=Xenopus laevis TaxID=8355 RepID=A0A974CVR7_XENLA|nr:hypothetical protein XELAEV_18026455mg [Xenopus laevis]